MKKAQQIAKRLVITLMEVLAAFVITISVHGYNASITEEKISNIVEEATDDDMQTLFAYMDPELVQDITCTYGSMTKEQFLRQYAESDSQFKYTVLKNYTTR
jgi:hypothetical protein